MLSVILLIIVSLVGLARALFPAVQFDFVWPGRAFAGFKKRLQTQQEDRPLCAAMVHELARLLPTLVFEQDDGPIPSLSELETDLRADPFFGPVDPLPQHASGGIKLKDLHVEAAGAKAKPEYATDVAFAFRGGRPPRGKTFDRGQCLKDTVEGRRFNSDLVQNIGHIRFLLLV